MDLIKGSRCLFKPEDCHFPAVSGIHRKLSIHVLSGSLNSSGSWYSWEGTFGQEIWKRLSLSKRGNSTYLPASLRANLRCQRRDANNTTVKISSPSLVSIDQWCSNLWCPLESSGSLKNFQMPGPPYREPHLICLGWGLGIEFFFKSHQVITLCSPLLYTGHSFTQHTSIKHLLFIRCSAGYVRKPL